jgi:hypothetical protein
MNPFYAELIFGAMSVATALITIGIAIGQWWSDGLVKVAQVETKAAVAKYNAVCDRLDAMDSLNRQRLAIDIHKDIIYISPFKVKEEKHLSEEPRFL